MLNILFVIFIQAVFIFILLFCFNEFIPYYFLSSNHIPKQQLPKIKLRIADNFTVWYQIPDRRIFIYPVAYEDSEQYSQRKIIKVLALKDHEEDLQYICYGYTTNGKIVKLGEAEDEVITLLQDSLFDAYFINCPCTEVQCAEDFFGISVIERANVSAVPETPTARIQHVRFSDSFEHKVFFRIVVPLFRFPIS